MENIPEPVMIPDATDQTLPKELREMFQALYCKLCSLQMTSNVMARMHYVSKNHEKKIRKYLIELAEKTGEPLHPRAAVTNVKKEKKEVSLTKIFHSIMFKFKNYFDLIFFVFNRQMEYKA